MKQPNILIVMVEHMSGLIDPQCSGPLEISNLARFANSAIDFRRSYCNAPVCGPSRLSFLTGLYPCNHGGYDNGSTLAPHIPTFGHLLTSAGYQTALCGRMHIHGLDQHRGFEYRPSSEIIDPREGAAPVQPRDLVNINPLPSASSKDYQQKFADSPIYRHDDYVTKQACQFIESPPEKDKPFCLVAGYADAHPGFAANPQHEPLYQQYLQRDLPVNTFSQEDYDQLPEHGKRFFHYHGDDRRVFDSQYHRHRLAIHYAALELLDIQFGKILASLEKSGQADNTIVIFTADHGEMMGAHGMWGKMLFYEEAQRIPMYVRVPGAWGTVTGRAVEQVVSLVDIAPTLVELASDKTGEQAVFAKVPMDGQSFLPELRDEVKCHNDNVEISKNGGRDARPTSFSDDTIAFSEYHGHLSGCDMYMVANHRYKLCHYTKEQDELYDLELDPQENNNRIDDPAYQAPKEALMQAITQRVDIEAMDMKLQIYRLQRQVSYDGIKNSAVTWNRINERNKYWRDQLNEPWWDSGKYLEQSERRAPEKNG